MTTTIPETISIHGAVATYLPSNVRASSFIPTYSTSLSLSLLKLFLSSGFPSPSFRSQATALCCNVCLIKRHYYWHILQPPTTRTRWGQHQILMRDIPFQIIQLESQIFYIPLQSLELFDPELFALRNNIFCKAKSDVTKTKY